MSFEQPAQAVTSPTLGENDLSFKIRSSADGREISQDRFTERLDVRQALPSRLIQYQIPNFISILFL